VLPDKIILLTPQRGFVRPTLERGPALWFQPRQLLRERQTRALKGTLEIIDINKLADEMGDKTVAVEAFEGDNLVLVDEGHRGTGKNADAWMRRRNAIISRGFAFEYSATFGQAVGKGHTVASAEEELLKNKSKTLFGTASPQETRLRSTRPAHPHDRRPRASPRHGHARDLREMHGLRLLLQILLRGRLR
jgi:hypothetical protein